MITIMNIIACKKKTSNYIMSKSKSTSYLKRVSNGPIEACCMSAYLIKVTFHIPQYTLAMNNNNNMTNTIHC